MAQPEASPYRSCLLDHPVGRGVPAEPLAGSQHGLLAQAEASPYRSCLLDLPVGRGVPAEPLTGPQHRLLAQPEASPYRSCLLDHPVGRGVPAEPLTGSQHRLLAQAEASPYRSRLLDHPVGRGVPAEPLTGSQHGLIAQPEDSPYRLCSLGRNYPVPNCHRIVTTPSSVLHPPQLISVHMKKLLLPTLLLFGLGAGASAQMLLNGAGATFPYPLYSKWFNEYVNVDSTVRFNYQAIGSGGGQKQILARTVDFGASDGPMSDETLAKADSQILHIPTVAGAVVVTYNLPGNPKLRLDGPAIADIYLGKITKWNDDRLKQLNPGVSLPNTDLIVVHRSDGSGTSYIFTDYLSSVSPTWAAKVGKNTSVKWPTGLGAKGNAGVAGQVKQLEGTVGYVELAYAHQNHLPFADLKNSAGSFVTPSLESIRQALATADIPDDFRFSMVNPPGQEAYPISGATWLLVYKRQLNHEKGEKLVQFLKWAATQGEEMAASLDYASLPENVRKRVLKRIDEIKY